MRRFDIPQMTVLQVLRVVASLLRPHWLRVAGIVVIVSMNSLLQSLNATLVVPILLMFFGDGGSGHGLLVDMYAALLAVASPSQALYVIAAAYLTSSLMKSVLGYFTEVLSWALSLDVLNELRQQILSGYLGRSYRFFLDRKQGELINDITQEPDFAADTIRNVVSTLSEILTLAGLLGVLLLLSWGITLAMLGVGVVMFFALSVFTRWARELSAREVENRRAVLSLAAESISGIRQIKVFSAEERIGETFHAVAMRLKDAWLKAVRVRAAGNKLVDAAVGIGITALLIGVAASDDLKTAGLTFVPIYMIATRIFPVLGALNYQRLLLVGRGSSVGVVDELRRPTTDGETQPGGRRCGRLGARLAFEDVTFGYQPGRPVLSGFSLVCEAGTTTAIVGRSGVGKSTVVDLIVRLFEPQAGRITADGTDIRGYELRSWRNAIGFVSQDTFIFNGTITENIRFGRPDATEDEIGEAAKLANAHEFIMELPAGYATVVGDRGLKLSGGQRQRVAIARALVRTPQIVIFDEATSALDSLSEAVVQDAIERVRKHRTVIMVAHRLSTIVSADQIVVLDCGQVAETGTHAQLLAAGGPYAKLYSGSGVNEAAGTPVGRSTPA